VQRRRLLVLLVAALAALAVAGPASARKGVCPRGSGCVWDEENFQGQMAQVPRNGCIDAHIRSAANGSDRPLQLFMGAGCRGPLAGTLPPGEDSPQISAGSATGAAAEDPADPGGIGVDPNDPSDLGGSAAG
jgi:Peptidase inhibitor family I36